MTRHRLLGPVAAAAVTLLFVATAAPAQDGDDEFKWVEKAVLRPQFLGQATETGAFQWVKGQPPQVAVVGGTKANRKAVATVVDDFHAALKGTPLKGLKLLPAGAGGATMLLTFLPRARIPAALAQAGWTADAVRLWQGDKLGYASQVYPHPSSKYVTNRAQIFVSSDAADEPWVDWGVTWSVAICLGVQFPRDYKESAFSEANLLQAAPRLKAADRQLLAWYYTHVPPGTKEIGPLYEKHYPEEK